MKMFLIVGEVLLIIIDTVAFVRLLKVFKENRHGDETVVPTEKVMPYVITMVVISILVPLINLILNFF